MRMPALPTLLFLSLIGFPTGCGRVPSNPDLITLRQLTTEGGNNPTWSGDGKTIIYVYNDDLWMVDAEGGTSTQLTDLDGRASAPEFLRIPGSRRLAFVHSSFPRGARPAIMEIGISDITYVESNEFYLEIGAPSWTSDGSHLLFITFKDRDPIRKLPVAGGPSVGIENESGWKRVYDAHTMAGEDQVIYLERNEDINNNIYMLPIAGGPRFALSNNYHLIGLHSVDVSWDGKWLAIASSQDYSSDFTLWTKEMRNPRESSYRQVTEDHDGRVYFPSWSPDGRHITYAAEINGVSNIWVADL